MRFNQRYLNNFQPLTFSSFLYSTHKEKQCINKKKKSENNPYLSLKRK